MNFLGHCLFSDPTPTALTGSLWPDFAPRPKTALSTEFAVHFDRHQRIDKITDTSPTLEPLRVILRPLFRKTTLVVVDMLLDHHLARHWTRYHHQPLAEFAQVTYRQLSQFDELPIPERMQKTLFWMQQHDWFTGYATAQGLQGAMEGMARRIRFANTMTDNSHLASQLAVQFEPDLHLFVSELRQQLNAEERH